ncbi:MAG: peptidase M1, partial [Bacteroidetes bacterium]
MKKYFLSAIVLAWGQIIFGQANDFRNPSIDVQHYDFKIKLSDADDHIEGEAVIQVKFLKNSTSLAFDLTQKNSSGKGMVVSSVKEKDQSLNFSQEQNILKITLSNNANVGDIREFEIVYAGVPSDGMIISRNKFGKRTFFADNWPNRAHNWIPCNDHPSDKASVEFEVTAPAHYQVVGNGILIEETTIDEKSKFTHWKEDVVIPTKVMAIGVAEFAIHYSGNVGNVPVYSWVFPENKKEGFYDYDQAPDIMPFYISKFGPYPYLKLAN